MRIGAVCRQPVAVAYKLFCGIWRMRGVVSNIWTRIIKSVRNAELTAACATISLFYNIILRGILCDCVVSSAFVCTAVHLWRRQLLVINGLYYEAVTLLIVSGI